MIRLMKGLSGRVTAVEKKRMDHDEYDDGNYDHGFTSIFYATANPRIGYLFIILIHGLQAFLPWLDMSGKQWRAFQWLKDLRAYKKEKMGDEWFKQKRRHLTTRALKKVKATLF